MKFALIVTDTDLNSKGPFYSLYFNFIKQYRDDLNIKTDTFIALNKEWPSNENEYDGFIFTGSAFSAYEEEDWINWLKEKIVELDRKEIKMLGICFGHQIIAQALAGNGTVQKNKKGWEIGQTDFQLSKEGRESFNRILNCNTNSNSNIHDNGASSPIPISKLSLSLYQIHQDIVTKLPNGVYNIGGNEICEIQGMIKPSTGKIGSYHILSFQGHPEFTSSFTEKLIQDLTIDPVFKSNSIQTITNHSDQEWCSKLSLEFFKN